MFQKLSLTGKSFLGKSFLCKIALESLLATERNFIMKKGETTVELERAKSESESVKSIIKAVPNLFKNNGK